MEVDEKAPEEQAGRKQATETDPRRLVHVHTLNGITDVARRHQHSMLTVSAPARAANSSHVHRVRGRTSFDCGHWHWYDEMSGPAVEMPNGTHTHYITGETSYDDGHCHDFAEVLGLAPDED